MPTVLRECDIVAPYVDIILILARFWQKVNKKTQKNIPNLHFRLEKEKKELYNGVENQYARKRRQNNE